MRGGIDDNHRSVVDHRLRKIAGAFRQRGDRRLLSKGIAAQGALVSEIEGGARIVQDLGNIQRAAHVQAKATDGIGGLRLFTAVKRIRSGVQGGVLQPQEHRTGVGGLVAPAIAEAGVLAVVGAATVVAIGFAAAATAAKSAATATSSAAEASASARSAAGALTSTTRTLAEASVDAAGSKTAQAERVAAGGAHPWGKAQSLAAARPAAQARPAICAICAGHAFPPGFVIARLGQTAAGAAIDQQRILGLRAQTGGKIGGRRVCSRVGQRLLAIVGGFHLGILKPWTGGGIRPATWTVTGSPARNGSLPVARPAAGPIARSARIGRAGRRLGETRHFQSPLPGDPLAADRYAVLHGGESEHLDLNIPDTGREFQCVTAGIVGVCHHLGAALSCRDGSSGNPLVGGPNRTCELS